MSVYSELRSRSNPGKLRMAFSPISGPPGMSAWKLKTTAIVTPLLYYGRIGRRDHLPRAAARIALSLRTNCRVISVSSQDPDTDRLLSDASCCATSKKSVVLAEPMQP